MKWLKDGQKSHRDVKYCKTKYKIDRGAALRWWDQGATNRLSIEVLVVEKSVLQDSGEEMRQTCVDL